MRVAIEGVGVLAPGLEGWLAGCPVLAGKKPFQPKTVPDPEALLLPPNERRRSSDCVRWAVQAAHEAMTQSGLAPLDVATVFASSGGEMDVLDRLCRTLSTAERMISPTLFHQSVHNTAAGYWGIATTCQQSSTALSCYDDSFAAGLLEAATFVCVEERPVLLVAYDLPPPSPLDGARPIHAGFAVACVLTLSSGRQLVELDVQLVASGECAPTNMRDEALERVRVDNPAARALPFLAALACGGEQSVCLNLLDDQRLIVKMVACRN